MVGSAREQRTFGQTRQHYDKLRELMYTDTEQAFADLGLRAREITKADARRADAWEWPDPAMGATWEWERMYSAYHQNRGVKRFDIAIDAGGQLCGLCYGVPSRRKLMLKLHVLERSPESNPLNGKFMDVLIYAAETYADLIGAEELWLMNVVNGRVEQHYGRHGFTSHPDGAGNLHMKLIL